MDGYGRRAWASSILPRMRKTLLLLAAFACLAPSARAEVVRVDVRVAPTWARPATRR
jgi:hypothetical protein